MSADQHNIEVQYSKKFGDSTGVRSLGWGSEESQKIRFEILKQIPNIQNNDSVLDVGCGHGDLSLFFNNYKGIDVRHSVIKIAREKYKNKLFETGSIFDESSKFDFVFASGIFAFYEINWKENVLSIVEEMIKKSNKGVGVNFLSSLSSSTKDNDMKYSSPSEISDIISKVSSKFIIRHDYRPNDMTVYILK